MGHARFGVTHGGWRVALDRPEISLAIDQRLAHRPRLRHVHKRGVNHRFAVRMIITAGVAADFCALAVLPPREKRQVVHRVKNSSLRRLEAVARVRQGTRDDHRHRVIEERPRYFFGHIHRFDFFVRVIHRLTLRKCGVMVFEETFFPSVRGLIRLFDCHRRTDANAARQRNFQKVQDITDGRLVILT